MFDPNDPADPGSRPEELPTSAEGHPDDQPTLMPDSPDATPDMAKRPEQIGGYRILDELGAGGMGVVYLAEQEQPHRQVALKVIRLGWEAEKLLKRFEQEAEVLGRLEHPGIARIYEAGVDKAPDGRRIPFFAMELVDGEPLTEYADRLKLGTRQRLELVSRICDAVQHAHGKGVIHRDLKPGNILVTRDGQPKILDFGVARSTDSDIQVTTIQTDVGQLIGTVPYMSPEQISGDPTDLDTRSDVYALGVISYELLAGRLPYELQKKMIHEAARIIREDDPTPLSTINRVFRGDVETIVGKSLAKEKDRRYQTASALGADIRRYLNDQPIAARPPSTVYQVKKFARRNKGLVAGLAASFVLLVAGVIVSTIFAISATQQRAIAVEALGQAEAEQERAELAEERAVAEAERATLEAERATLEAAKAERTSEFLTSILESVDPTVAAGRDTELLEDILSNATERIDTELSDQPEIEISVRDTIGGTYRMITKFEESEEQLLLAVERARAELSPEDVLYSTTINNLAVLYSDQGRHEEALEFYLEALELRTRFLGREHAETLTTISNIALCYSDLGRLDEAEALYEEALPLREIGLADDPAASSELLAGAGVFFYLRGDYDRAVELLTGAYDVRREAFGEEHPFTLRSMIDIAVVKENLGQTEEAEELYVRAVDRVVATYGPEHPTTMLAKTNYANLLSRQQRFDEAIPLLKESVEVRSRTLGAEHDDTLVSRNSLLVAYMRQGNWDAAKPLGREITEIYLRTLGEDHPDTLISMNNLAWVERYSDNPEGAEELFRTVIERHRKILNHENLNRLNPIVSLAGLLRSQERHEETIELYLEVYEVQRGILGVEHRNTYTTAYNYASSLRNTEREDEVRVFWQEHIEQMESIEESQDTPLLGSSYSQLGSSCLKLDLFVEAEQAFRECYRIRDELEIEGDQRAIFVRSAIGAALTGQGRHEEAEAELLAAYEAIMAEEEPNEAFRDRTIERIVSLYESWEKPAEAQVWASKAETPEPEAP